MVALACAHPAKFPDAVESAIGLRPDAAAARSPMLMARPERIDVLPNELAAVERFVARPGAGAAQEAHADDRAR